MAMGPDGNVTTMGIDVGATTIAGGLVTGAGDVLEVVQVRTHGGGPGTAVETLFGVVDTLLAKSAARGLPLLGIGVGVPGAIDPEKGAMDFRGLLGHDKSVRNGFSDIRYTVTIKSPAPEDKVRRCKETIDRKSPVRDTLANPVRITSDFVYKPR